MQAGKVIEASRGCRWALWRIAFTQVFHDTALIFATEVEPDEPAGRCWRLRQRCGRGCLGWCQGHGAGRRHFGHGWLQNRDRRSIPPTGLGRGGARRRAAEALGGTGKLADAAEGVGAALRTEVRNGYTYTFDAGDRVSHIEGELASNQAQGRNPAAQLEAGGPDRLPTDEGGHYVGRRFNGPLDAFSHFAQDTNFNRGAYKTLENRWQRALDNGSSVQVDITPHYPGTSLRPQSLDVNYSIDGVPYQKTFLNRPGGQ